MARGNFLTHLFSVANQTQMIKSNELTRRKSVRFGVTSIIFSAIAVAFAVGAALLLNLLNEGDNTAVALLLFTIAGVAVCIGGALTCFVNSLIRVIAQLSINRRAIGWVSLGILIAGLIAAVVVFIVILG